MKRGILLLGQQNHQKHLLSIYIANIIQAVDEAKVVITTDKNYYTEDDEIISLKDGIEVMVVDDFTEAEQAEYMYDYIIYDVQSLEGRPDDSEFLEGILKNEDVILTCNHELDVYRECVINMEIIGQLEEQLKVNIFLYNYLQDSRIAESYLKGVIEESAPDTEKTYYNYQLNLLDQARMTDQSHNKKYGFKKLSKEFKAGFIYPYIFGLLDITDKKQQTKTAKRIERLK